MNSARAARIADETCWARELAADCAARGRLTAADPGERSSEDLDGASLSLFLAARLPLSPLLQADMLACTCPLTRLHDVVDSVRPLNEPSPRRERPGHRFVLREDGDSRLVVHKRGDGS